MNTNTTPNGNAKAGQFDSAVDKTAAVAHDVVERTAHTTAKAALRAHSGVEHGAEFAHQAVDSAAGAAHDLFDKGARLQQGIAEGASQCVTRHPLKVLGVALGLGFLLGHIL